MNHHFNELYYKVKPFVPRSIQLFIRRKLICRQQKKYQQIWPIDEQASSQPLEWCGWPEGKKFALVLTHDVDTAKGQERCLDLMNLEKDLGFTSSFNFVPLRYSVSEGLRNTLEHEGFEVGVHGLYHDGMYYRSREFFRRRVKKINQYLKEWRAVGYRAPAMYHKLEWFHDLDIEYDASTFDTDPFEPHSVGVGTIFPFFVMDQGTQKRFVELPYTLPQDFTLFVLMQQKGIQTWKNKLEWVAKHGGMVLINTHPDYMTFGRGKPGNEEYPAQYYTQFLEHLKENFAGQYWHVLPRDMARYWNRRYSSEWFQWHACKYPYYNGLIRCLPGTNRYFERVQS